MQRSPSERHHPMTRALAAWLLGALVCFPPCLPAARAEVEGEQVRRGRASFHRDGDLTVIRPSDGAIIDYTRFDILRQETVRFEQPSERSRVLNRVYGGASRIDGTLQANGIVYLVNPSGIFFGRDAVVDVGRLHAAAGHMRDRDFLKGIDRFQLTGAVENLGRIEARSVSLLGRSVANHGSILAPNGVIALVAGERVVLTRAEGGIAVEVDGGLTAPDTGIQQTGTLDAGNGLALFAVGDHYSLALNHTGMTRARDIDVRGGDGGLVRIAGTLDASSREPGRKGGRIRVTGDKLWLEGATLDASGMAGGGRLRLGGSLRGAGPLPSANRVFVDEASSLRADALAQGDGGSIVIFSEQATGFLGSASARGGLFGGDGGFVELSSNGRLVDRGDFDLGAPQGRLGTLLYDPQDILIVGGAGASDGDVSDGSILFGDEEGGPAPFQIFEEDLETTNANIVLEARNSIRVDENEDFDHIQDGEGVGVLLIQSGNDFTLRTRNNASDDDGTTAPPGIDLTTSPHGDDLEVRLSGDGAITMQTGTGNETGSSEAPIAVGRLTTAGGQVFLETADGSIAANTIDTSGADDPSGAGGDAGRILFDARDADGSNDTAIVVTGELIARGGDGGAGSGGRGGVVSATTHGTPLPTPRPDPLPDARGGGDITLGDIDTRGGNAVGGAGGAGGIVQAVAEARGDIVVGDVVTRGGDGQDAGPEPDPDVLTPGGFGGSILLTADDGDITVGAVDTTGGATDGSQRPAPPMDPEAPVIPLERGGGGGTIVITAGRGSEAFGAIDDPQGDILLTGTLTAFGGDGGGGAGPGEDNVNGDGLGGNLQLNARDSIEHDGDAGPHIATDGNVTLIASAIGADGTLVIDGGGDGELDIENRPTTLAVTADGRADVAVPTPAFELIAVTSRDADNDIDVVQGGDVIRVDGDTINRIDTTAEHTSVQVILRDQLNGPLDVALDLVVPTGSIDAGSQLRLEGEDDVILGDGAGVAIAAHEDPFSDLDDDDETGRTAAAIAIFANADNGDKDHGGAIVDGGGRIDRNADGVADGAGFLFLSANDGIGTQAAPIQTSGGGDLQAQNGRVSGGTEDDGGIFVRNASGGDADLTVVSARVFSGAGDIDLENADGDVVLEGQVRTSGGPDPDGSGPGLPGGGDIVLAGEHVVIAAGGTPLDANGAIELEGDVLLRRNTGVRSRTERAVRIDGGIDSDPATDVADDPETPEVDETFAPVFSLNVDTEGATTITGDVGATKDVSTLTIGGDLALAGDRSIDVTQLLDVRGDVLASGGADSAGLTVRARTVRFGGDIGTDGNDGNGSEQLSGLAIERNTTPPFAAEVPPPTVVFDGDGAQTVRTGAGGITFDGARTEVPDVATVGKSNGDLTLDTTGQIDFGQNEKLTVQGVATLNGDTGVTIGDVSALELHVDSPDTQVRRRDPGSVVLKNGERAADEGTDLIANVVRFTGSAPTEVGTGPAVRIAAGTVENAGAIAATGLSGLDADRMERAGTLLDLAILPADPGHEQPLRGPDIGGIVPPRTTQERPAGSALPPDAQQTIAWLRCDAPTGSDCPQAPVGSPLDTPRGLALAQSAEGWLGSSADARARRAAAARLEPHALHELADFLTEVRLLGLSDSDYQAVRDALYVEILSDAGSGAPEPAVLAQGVQAQAPGIPL